MPSILETVSAEMGTPEALAALKRLVGDDDAPTEKGAEQVGAVTVAALAARTADDEGASAVSDLVKAAGSNALDDVPGAIDASPAPGARLVTALFGEDRSGLVDHLAAAGPLKAEAYQRLLAPVATVVTGVLARRVADDDLDPAALAALLEGEATTGDDDAGSDGDDAWLATALAAGGGTAALAALAADGGGDGADGEGTEADGTAADGGGDGEGTEAEADGKAKVAKAAVVTAPLAATSGVGSGSGPGASGDAEAAAEVEVEVASDDGPGRLASLAWLTAIVLVALAIAWLLSNVTNTDDDVAADGEAETTTADDGPVADAVDAVDANAGDDESAETDEPASPTTVMDDDASPDADRNTSDADVSSDDASSGGADGDDGEAAGGEESSSDGATSTDGGAAGGEESSSDGATSTDGDDDADVAVSSSSDDASADGDGDASNSEPADGSDGDGDGDGDSATSAGGRSTTTGDADDGATAADDDAVTADVLNEVLDLEPITFDYYDEGITAEGRRQLDVVIGYLEANDDVGVEIRGHTDAIGDASLNVRLGLRRADAVKAYLVNNGIDGDRLFTVGVGEVEPIASNATESGRLANRRIELLAL
ncbi:MAG: OmpA family protein [Actinomycetota bacterium]